MSPSPPPALPAPEPAPAEHPARANARAATPANALAPIVVRLDGNAVEEGRAILAELNHPQIKQAETMDEGARMAAELAVEKEA